METEKWVRFEMSIRGVRQRMVVPLSGLDRGLFDWSGGRAVLDRLMDAGREGHIHDIKVVEATWDDIDA